VRAWVQRLAQSPVREPGLEWDVRHQEVA
jgi:hypothetical protein